jgi:hypothetical protein
MITRRLLLALLLTGATGLSPAAAQVFTPQSGTGITVTFQSEKMGGSRVLIFGDVRNATGQTYERVVLLAEGLDAGGQVVSRGRTYVSGTVNPNSSTAFELRFLASGAERRYRVTVESFQQVQN